MRLAGTIDLEGTGKPSHPLDPFRLAYKLLSYKDTVFFSPGYNPPLFSGNPFVLTLHDLNHLDFRENSSPLKRLYYQLILRPQCRKAQRLLTISSFSRRRIIEWTGLAPEMVINVGNGVDSSFCLEGPKHEPGYSYIFSVSNRKAHKNEVRMLEAFARANLNSEIKLLITGITNKKLKKLTDDLNISDRVVFTGSIAEEEMPCYYRGASALLFPSLYEGFGLPVIEAMACGTPVITSNIAALPEVAHDAALLVDPYDIDDIATTLKQLLDDTSLQRELMSRGKKRAALYNWDDVAAKVQQVLDDVRNS